MSTIDKVLQKKGEKRKNPNDSNVSAKKNKGNDNGNAENSHLKQQSFETLPSETLNIIMPNGNEFTSHNSNNEDDDGTVSDKNSDSDEAEENNLLKLIELTTKMLEIQSLMLQKLNTLLKNVDNLSKRNLQQNKIRNDNTMSNDDIASIKKYFPLDNDENNENNKIDVVESKLHLEKKFCRLLVNLIAEKNELIKVCYMKNIGGANSHDLVLNIFQKLFKDEVLINYSFLGRKKTNTGEQNLAFAGLKIADCISYAVNESFPGTTEEQIKRSISSWLDGAATRIKRSQNKTPRVQPFKPLDLDIDEEEQEDI